MAMKPQVALSARKARSAASLVIVAYGPKPEEASVIAGRSTSGKASAPWASRGAASTVFVAGAGASLSNPSRVAMLRNPCVFSHAASAALSYGRACN